MGNLESASPTSEGLGSSLADHVRDWVSTALPVAGLVAVYYAIDTFVRRISDLGESGYSEPSLIWELSKQSKFAVPLVVFVVAGALVLTHTFGPRWPAFERGWTLAVPVGVPIVLLTWWFATYDYNLFLDQGHWSDRIVLVVLGALALWRPVFAVPWVLLIATIINQFFYPIGGYSVAEQFQLLRIVELFIALLVIWFVVGRWFRNEFLVVLFSLLASGFFISGLGKVRLRWFEAGAHVEANLLATYSNGWLGFLGPGSIGDLAQAVGWVAWPLMVGTLIVELGSVFILWGRRFLLPRLFVFVLFHLGVVSLTGIFFWRWIVMELALIAFLRRDDLVSKLKIFTSAYVLIAAALVFFGPWWAKPTDLSWIEAPVNYVYRFGAVDASGNTGELSPEFFQPFDYAFTLSPFGYLAPDPQLPVVWGAIRERDIAVELNDASSVEEILAIEQTRGWDQFDSARAETMDRFISTFVGNWNLRGGEANPASVIGPPRQLLSFGHDSYVGTGPIETVMVSQVMTYWDGSEYQEIRIREIRRIDIP